MKILGRLFDRNGNAVIGVALTLTAAATGAAFLAQGPLAEAGAALWGIGTVMQDSLLLALVSSVITERRGATTFGLYDLLFGVAWFAGSAVAGLLLDRSTVALVVFSIVLQLLAVPFFTVHKASQRSVAAP